MTYPEPSFVNYLWHCRPNWLKLNLKSLVFFLICLTLVGLTVGMTIATATTPTVTDIDIITTTPVYNGHDAAVAFNALLNQYRI